MARQRSKRAAKISSRRSIRIDTWLLRHLQVSLASLGRLTRAPLSTLMTSGVIGIALSLPAGLYLLLDNVQNLSGNWEGAASISLFMEHDVSSKELQQTAIRLRGDDAIADVQVVNREQALEEFRRQSGFSTALDALDQNPLPALLIVAPNETHSAPAAAEALLKRLRAIDGVDHAQLDLQWVRRFSAITQIAQRGVLVLASLLGLAVLLIIGNTIRLEIQNRQAEIEITKLIGGTDGFIRRPFLYNGLWYGLFGGLMAWLLVTLSLWLLDGPVAQLAGLYHSDFDLSGINLGSLMILLGGSSLLGLIGSWIAVGRHLSDIEPS